MKAGTPDVTRGDGSGRVLILAARCSRCTFYWALQSPGGASSMTDTSDCCFSDFVGGPKVGGLAGSTEPGCNAQPNRAGMVAHGDKGLVVRGAK